MERAFEVLVLLTCLGSGLVGGAFFVFSVMVMPALRRLSSPEGIRAMQAINIAAVRPLFMAAFLGTTVLSLGLGLWTAVRSGDGATTRVLIACALSIVGSFGVTAAYHVPRNNILAAMDSQAAATSLYWQEYQRGWTRMNHVRAVPSAAASLLLAVAL